MFEASINSGEDQSITQQQKGCFFALSMAQNGILCAAIDNALPTA